MAVLQMAILPGHPYTALRDAIVAPTVAEGLRLSLLTVLNESSNPYHQPSIVRFLQPDS
jgi:hypothetical protein